ncbi:MAG: RHS repeat-associated core domain-containing protein [Bacteroidota bacterium]|nr:RHS repeat-associated core domain-containing protein [Bacteroidota bacterium]
MNGKRYRYGFNGKEKDNETYGEGNAYDFGARIYDSRLGRWLSLDPLMKRFPWQSPYCSMDNNPIAKIDPTGMSTKSTHTDKDGNVIAVINDGDKGVYKHGDNKDGKAPTQYQIQKRQKKLGTSAGGKKMGETWTLLGFADFAAYEKDGTIKPAPGAKIDFNSNWANDKVKSILDKNPSAGAYALKARINGDYDIKKQAPNNNPYYGSLLFGKFASARDAGNFTAVAVAQNSIVDNQILDYGFGVYNQSGNDVNSSLIQIVCDILFLIMPGTNDQAVYEIKYTIANGEDKLSKDGIEAGKAYAKIKR